MAKKTIKSILEMLKVSEETIKSVVGETDHEVEIDDSITIMSSEDKDTLIKNSNKEAQKAAREILIKEMKSMVGLEFEGKTPEKFIENYKTHVLKDANVSVDEKVKEKDSMISELRNKITEKESEYAKLNDNLSQFKRNSLIQSSLPKNRDTKLKDEDYITLLNNKVQLIEEEGSTIVSFNGKKLTDDKLNPLPVDKAFESVFKEQGWLSSEGAKKGGAGFGDDGRVPNKFNKLSDIKTWAESNGKTMLSSEVQTLVKETIASNPNFIYE
jgi:hypothetical protein